ASDVIKHRTHIQLPLYAYLLQKRFADKEVKEIGIYSLRNLNITLLTEGRNLQELIQAAINTTMNIIQKIRTGKFPAQPAQKNDSCRHCSLSFTCGRGV
ncbi:MAG: PD-(D/E)XK nuclease family protein, partial [bacterium]